MMKKWTYFLCLLASFLVISCGDLFTTERDPAGLSISKEADCKLETEAFSYILEKDISSDILCLKNQLNLFISLVETDRPGFISKSVLKTFLLEGPLSNDIDPEVADIIDTVFEMSNLIMGTDKNYIKKSEMHTLIDFLTFFNSHIWKTYTYFDSPDDVNYTRHSRERKIVYEEIKTITNGLKKIFKANRDRVDTIDTEKLMFNFFKNDPETMEKINSIMFVKRAILGGQKWEMTHHEFSNLITVIPELIQVSFDIAKSSKYTFVDEQATLLKLFKQDIEVVRRVLFFRETSTEAMFTTGDVIGAIKTLAPSISDSFDVAKYPEEFKKIKEVFLGSNSEFFAAKEIYTLLNHVEKIIDTSNLFYRVYDFYEEELNGPDNITHDFGDFPVNSSTEQKYLSEFANIANNYKFFKGSFGVPFYTFDNHRNPNGFVEIMAVEYFIKNAFRYYGSKKPEARGGYDITLEQFEKIAYDFRWIFKEAGLVVIGREGGGELKGISENVILMSTLFQNQSNGCDSKGVCMETPELTEFLVGLLTALNVKDFFTEKMIELCATELDMYDRIAPECFRRNFIDVIEAKNPKNGMVIADQMPFFYDYLKTLVEDVEPGRPYTDSEEYMSFLLETEAFTRTCTHYDAEKTEEIPLKANDAFAVFAGLLNVESTVLRFDTDRSNVLNYRNEYGRNEILDAYYEVYHGAIKGLLDPKGGFLTKLAKPMFQYLIKEGKVPDVKKFKSIWHFAKFLLKRNKNANANRDTFATVLKVIGEQNDGDKKPFKCDECFRDPTVECEPEGDDWN